MERVGRRNKEIQKMGKIMGQFYDKISQEIKYKNMEIRKNKQKQMANMKKLNSIKRLIPVLIK